MKYNHSFLLITLTSLTLLGCTEFPYAFKQDTPQGNIIEQTGLDQLKPGMSKEQVGFLVGYPVLKDTFKNDRWDYLYLFYPGRGEPRRRLVTLYFTGGTLSHITGEVTATPPTETTNVKKAETQSANTTTPASAQPSATEPNTAEK